MKKNCKLKLRIQRNKLKDICSASDIILKSFQKMEGASDQENPKDKTKKIKSLINEIEKGNLSLNQVSEYIYKSNARIAILESENAKLKDKIENPT